METESRKRPHTDDDDNLQIKKRAIESPNGSPHVNGTVEIDEVTDAANLELFRKEAIFRKMKHYSREHERSQARIAELERRKNTCEAGLAAITACWTQLVEAIRIIVRPDDLPPVDLKTREIFNMTAHLSGDPPPDFVSALEDNMNATQTLLTKFMQLGGQKLSPLMKDETYLSCQKAQTECITLRSQMDIMRVQLLDSVAEKETLHTALVAAQTRADRLQSATILAMQARAAVPRQEIKEEEVEQPQQELPSPPEPSQVDESKRDPPDAEDWQEIIQAKERRIVDLEHEIAVLQDEKHNSAALLKLSWPKSVASTPLYKTFLAHASKLEHTAKEDREEVARLREQLDQLRQTRREFEEGVINATGQANQELKMSLAKRDAENLRLRDQREQQTSELNERKQRESVKTASLQELKALAESRSERILVLQSEVARCKQRLAADTTNEDLMSFLLRNDSEDASYVEDIKSRLSAAETRIQAFEQSLCDLEGGNPEAAQHMKAEAETRQQLAKVTRKLERFQSLYGDVSALPLDVQQLSGQLQQKEEEIQRLRLSDTQRTQAESPLYAELDRLSAAWEALDRQVRSKVFDQMAMEERLTKSLHEKAKSDNKFFAAMRDKEAIDAERKNLSRNLEKQAKVIEKLSDSEKNLLAQVSDLERELSIARDVAESHRHDAETAEYECKEWKHRAELELARSEEYRSMWQEREKTQAQRSSELRKAEEAFLRSKKDLERQSSKFKVTNFGNASQKEAAIQHELDKYMRLLKCSTCNQQMRSMVLTKCMHTFCKECVDARISTRQRKCPACNIPFAQSEVQAIWFQ